MRMNWGPLSAYPSRLWWSALLLLVQTSAVSGDEFFGDQLSAREKYASEASMESATTALEGISALQLMLEYKAFAEGRCEGYFELETAAKNGDGKSQHILSDLYRNGYCVPQDDARALQWARKAADGGYEPAYFDVGYFYRQGIGTDKNPAAAARWLEKATGPRIEAHYLLAMIYWHGEGVTQNYQKAYEYALRGAQPLFVSVMIGNTELVKLLLEHGANPNLRFELEAGHVPMILVDDAKSTVMNGGSLLQLAVVEQHAGIARLLVQHGADKDAADNLGRTPLSVAESDGDNLMIAVLKGDM